LPHVDVEISFGRTEQLEDGDQLALASSILSDSERDRAARFRFPRDARSYVRARALLRETLSRWCDVPARAWRFEADSYGRPVIASPRSGLRFSVSHTARLVAVAVTTGRDIGIDAEQIPASIPYEILGMVFTAGERRLLESVDEQDRTTRFAELWTLKEAYAKARGLGLSLPLDRYGFALDPPRLVSGPDDDARWQLESMKPLADHRAALCVRGDGQPPVVSTRWDDVDRSPG
jgi:4'-phosphopantetheinyl transferase